MTEEMMTQDLPEEGSEEREIVFEEALEAVLFAAGHPVSYATLARVFGMTPGKVKDRAFNYSLKYNDSELQRGVILLCYDDSCQLCTKQDYLPEIREALGIKKSGSLSTSSMEALAIVAYNQPVTRFFVDTLRSADSSYAMNNLIDRGLIESKGRLDVPGRPMVFGTTADFLRSFGLPSIAALPKESDELMQMFDKAREAEEKKTAEAEIEQGDQITMEASALETAEEVGSELTPKAETPAEAPAEPEFEEPSADDTQFDD